LVFGEKLGTALRFSRGKDYERPSADAPRLRRVYGIQ
jgi:hypothetical protein